jgi:hypothetical protein
VLLSIERTEISGNLAGGRGGVFAMLYEGVQATITDSVITGNTAGFHLRGRFGNSGGGIWAYLVSGESPANLTLAGSEISANTAGDGGGGVAVVSSRESEALTVSNQLSVYNTTISGNRAGVTNEGIDDGIGGGVHLSSFYGGTTALDAHFQNVTLTGNNADRGAGIWSEVREEAPALRFNSWLTNSIVSDNKTHLGAPNNLHGSFNIDATLFNLIGSGNATFDHTSHLLTALRNESGEDPASGNIFDDDPMLGPLADNGGLTRTHRPSTGSAAIDAGSNPLAVIPFTSDPLETDQRGQGFPRPFDVLGVPGSGQGPVDIGAYEISLPKVIDVRLDNPDWEREAFSYAELVAAGRQLRPIPVNNVTQIQILFSEPVMKQTPGGTRTTIGSADGNALMILTRTVRNVNGSTTTQDVAAAGFSYDDATQTATWTYSGLVDGKYAIHLKTGNSPLFIVDAQGNPLDGDWINDTQTPDNLDDQAPRPFLVGDGMVGSEGNEFRFHFAVLSADFTNNGAVGGEDFAIWQNHYGEMNQPLGDANGDLFVNDADHAIWVVATSLPLWGVNCPDFMDDEFVNELDLDTWIAGWGATGQGDIDGDGDTDNHDFLAWQSSFGPGAWYIEGTMAEAAVAPIDDDPVGDMTLPKVMNVIISGSQSMHAPFAMNTVDGSGHQLRTVPVGGADTISITFSEGVNVSAGSLMLVSLHLTFRPDLAEFYYDALTHTATWRFEGWPLADQYLLSLTDKVTDAYGNPLDGEWTNPWNNWSTNAAISEFPSGDGTPGGMFNFVITLLPGDANLDGWVDSSDYLIWQAHYAQDGGWVEGDFNGDGLVGSEDQAIFNQTYGLNYQAIWVGCDLDGDLDVDDADLDVIFDNAGMANPTFQDGDFNFDGEIDVADRDIALAQYMLHGSCGLFVDAVW